MNHWQNRSNPEAGWEHLQTVTRPDIALLQEAVPPKALTDSRQVVYQEIGDRRQWGTVVYAEQSLSIWPIPFASSHPGAATAVEVRHSSWSRAVTAVSIYGLLERLL